MCFELQIAKTVIRVQVYIQSSPGVLVRAQDMRPTCGFGCHGNVHMMAVFGGLWDMEGYAERGME